jgi:MGT family glycosyltransferase
MAYYAMLLPAYTGHVNPMIVLGRALQKRGHRVVMLSPLEAEEKLRRAGFEYIPVAAREFPAGEWSRLTAQQAERIGWEASWFVGRWLGRFVRGILQELPAIAQRERFDGLVMDQISCGTESVCEVVGVPLAVACCALMGHAESTVPPIVFSWPPRTSLPCRVRNVFGQMRLNATGWWVVQELMRYRLKHRLPYLTYTYGNELPPSLVQVAQTPAFLDFPRRHLPEHFHYTGPWLESAGSTNGEFPWHRLNGRPLIYASFGTLQNRLQHAFRLVAEACAGLEAQLVLTLGSKGAPLPDSLPGDPVVVDYAPQVALLRRARLVIGHGGLNTTLECLSEGLPLIALPITNDQPGVAARIAHFGVGEFIPIRKLTAAKLRQAICRVLASPSYRQRAENFAVELRKLDGPHRAAELIEQAFTSRKKVKREVSPTVGVNTSNASRYAATRGGSR